MRACDVWVCAGWLGPRSTRFPMCSVQLRRMVESLRQELAARQADIKAIAQWFYADAFKLVAGVSSCVGWGGAVLRWPPTQTWGGG